MFLITDLDNACLLEQRPPEGIWGGLWTPPERDAQYSFASLCREFDIIHDDVEATHTAAEFRHTFTHFHLDIEPVHVHLRKKPSLVRDNPHLLWYSVGDDQHIGLSAPAVRLLNSLAEIELS